MIRYAIYYYNKYTSILLLVQIIIALHLMNHTVRLGGPMLSSLMILDLHINFTDGTRIHPFLSNVLHGIMMEHIDTNYATKLHESTVHPYRQYVFYDAESDTTVWRVIGLNQEAIINILEPLFHLPDEVFVRQQQKYLQIMDRIIYDETSYDELYETMLEAPLSNVYAVDLEFITSASFKSQGEYIPFPDVTRFFKGLLRRWNAFSENHPISGDHLAETLASLFKLHDYQLFYSPYRIERVQIPAFKGHYTLRSNTKHPLFPIAMLLLAYGEFAGLGIKTSLGMGAYRLTSTQKDTI